MLSFRGRFVELLRLTRDLIKRFWNKFTCSFCKLDHFKAMQLLLVMFIKRCSLQKLRVLLLMYSQKSFLAYNALELKLKSKISVFISLKY
jgi:hypothetical protein